MTPPATDTDRVVVCMKWGSKYGAEYVDRLCSMVRRHLRGDFRFVCLTDHCEGVRSEVRCLPIPPLDLPPASRSAARYAVLLKPELVANSQWIRAKVIKKRGVGINQEAVHRSLPATRSTGRDPLRAK